MVTRIQHRRGTASQWATANPVLAAAEPSYETDTGIEKVGDGITAYTSLAQKPALPVGYSGAGALAEYIRDTIGTALVAGANVTVTVNDGGDTITIASTGGGGGGLDVEAMMDFLSGITTAGKGLLGSGLVTVTPNDGADTITITTTATQNSSDATLLDRANHTGAQAQSTVTGLVAGLAAKADLVSGLVPSNQIPAIAISDTFPVASQAAMLALTAQRGDVAIRSDVAKTFILSSDSPGTLADWKELPAIGAVTSVAGRQGVVVLAKADVGLGNVDNTTDAAKPVSTAQQTEIDTKSDLGHHHTIADIDDIDEQGYVTDDSTPAFIMQASDGTFPNRSTATANTSRLVLYCRLPTKTGFPTIGGSGAINDLDRFID